MRRRGRKRILLDLRKHLTLDLFNCDGVQGEKVRYQGREYTPTEFVREQTRLWRESWVFPLIDELLQKEK